ncbi:MAG: hypothetical protein IPN59_14470 [Holophaga sp.]|nr:hypothetical protein [Holophaga sp.]
MRRVTHVCIVGSALLLLGACGGSDKTPTTPLPPQTAADTAISFLLTETTPATPSTLPTWKPTPDGQAMTLSRPALADALCITAAIQSNQDGSTTYSLTYDCTNLAEASTLTGTVAYTFSPAIPGSYRVDYQNLKAVKGTQSWSVSGAKQIMLDLVNKKAALTTLAPMVVTVVNGAETTLLSYTCNLTGDWGTAGLYKVAGGFSLQSGNALPVVCSLASPLTWDLTSGCCHPVSGQMALVQGSASANVAFSLPCGTYQVSNIQTFAPATLPTCPN